MGSHQKVSSRRVKKLDLLKFERNWSDSQEKIDWKWRAGRRFLQEPGWEMVAEIMGIEKRA